MIILKHLPLDDIDFAKIKGGYAFGMRIHPIYKELRMHDGVDITKPMGTPIYAVADGTVTVSKTQGNSRGYGEYIVIEHGDWFSLYAHQSRRKAVLNQKVKAGDIIGYVGSTGDSKGNHLHFGVGEMFFSKERGWVDPVPYMKKVEEEEDMTRYNKVSEMPSWAAPTVKKLVEKKIIVGNDKGELDLSQDMVRMLVYLDRAKVFG